MADISSSISDTDIKLYTNLMVHDEHNMEKDKLQQSLSSMDHTQLPSHQLQPSILNDIEEYDAQHDEHEIHAETHSPARRISDQAMYDPADLDVDQDENKNPDIRRQKQEILFQLLKEYPDEAKGQWNIHMPLFELKYELKRRQTYQTEKDQIHFMKQLLKMLLIGIEYGNKKLGPILELDGWSQSVTSDMSKFDRCMTALYRRYFKRKAMDPIVEFVWLLLGSMIMWHIQSKYLGGNPTPPKKSSPDIAPPPGQFSYNNSGPASSQMDLSSLFSMFVKR